MSAGNLDSSLCFIQPGISVIYSVYKLSKQNVVHWKREWQTT